MNPRFLFYAIITLSLIGLSISSILTYDHYLLKQNQVKTDPNEPLCYSCEEVNISAYSEIFGIPVALIGLVGFLFILLLALYGSLHTKSNLKIITITIFILSMMGIIFSAYLIYIEIFVLKYVCPLCMAASLINIIIFPISIILLKYHVLN